MIGDWCDLGLFDYGTNPDYFGQYWNLDNSNDYFLVWEHDQFIHHFSPKKHLEISPLKDTQNVQIKKFQIINNVKKMYTAKHLMNKTNILTKIYIYV